MTKLYILKGLAGTAAVLSALLLYQAAACASQTMAASQRAALSALRLAQAGSAGGSIGNQNKSVSGGQPDAAPAKSSKHETSAKHERRSAARQASLGHGGVARFDGAWKVVTAAQGCPYSADATISGGVITSNGFTGSVTSGGALTGVFSLAGYTATVVGRLSGNSGNGTFKRNDGCAGEWTMVKQ